MSPPCCTHCSNGCQNDTERAQQQNLRAKTATSQASIRIPVRQGRFGFDFTQASERLKLPLVRRDGNSSPQAGKTRLRKFPGGSLKLRKASGRFVGFIGSNPHHQRRNYMRGHRARVDRHE